MIESKDYEMSVEILGITFINNSYLYEDIKYFCKNLARKQIKGIYDKEKAIKGFLPIVKKALTVYAKEFYPSHKWYEIATPSERLEIAEYMLERNEELIETYRQDIINK